MRGACQIYDLAGIAGVNPDPFTLRELVKLADARCRFEWEQTSAQMALLVNMFRDQKKSKPARAADFNPYFRESSDQVMMNVPVSVLKDVFFKKKPEGC